MEKNFINNLYFRILGPIAYGFMVYILVLLVNDRLAELTSNFELFEVLFCVTLTYANFEALRLLVEVLEKQFKNSRRLQIRMFVQFGVAMLVSLCITYLMVAAYFIYLVGFSTFSTELYLFGSIFLVSSLFYNALYLSLLFLHRRNEIVLQKEMDLKKNIEYRLQAFKNEVNPTLLYHSLETLISLIYENRDKADDYINSLANYYRYALDNKQDELTSLAKDIAAGKNLVSLLNFDNAYIHLSDETEADFQEFEIVPGSVPQLIFHLVRNSIISATHPLNITLFTQGEAVLGFKCKLNERLQPVEKPLREIKDLQQAYAFYTEEPIVRVKAYQEVTIKVPLLQSALEEIE